MAHQTGRKEAKVNVWELQERKKERGKGEEEEWHAQINERNKSSKKEDRKESKKRREKRDLLGIVETKQNKKGLVCNRKFVLGVVRWCIKHEDVKEI